MTSIASTLRPNPAWALWSPAAASLIAALLLICPVISTAAAQTRIVTREGARRIVAISPSGGRPKTLYRLRRGAILGIGVSRDGNQIAFAARTWDNSHAASVWTDRVWIMRGDGSHAHSIRSFVSSGRSRADIPIDSIDLAPNGKRVLLMKRAGAVFIMRVDGSGLRQVSVPGFAFSITNGRNFSGPEFTPDGRRLIGSFYSTESPGKPIRGIGTVAAAGGPIHFLRVGLRGSEQGSGYSPTVSRDGRFVAFVTREHTGERWGSLLVVMRRDGSSVRVLRRSLIPGWSITNPSFSPTGNALAFMGEKVAAGGTTIGVSPSDIFTIRRDGTNLRVAQRETAHLVARNPIWSP